MERPTLSERLRAMAAKSKSKSDAGDPNSRTICRNRRARHDFEIVDEIECGIVLTGSEVKSIRNNKVSIDEAFARVEKGEVWLFNADIAEYPQATYLNHERRRPRKLLLRRREIRKFAESAGHDGMTLIPLSLYFSKGIVKVELAAAKGRKSHDKRENIKTKEADRAMRSAVRRRT